MATVGFHPHFRSVLGPVVAGVAVRGTMAVKCPPGVSALVLAEQIARYASESGVPVRCEAKGATVRVTSLEPIRRGA